MKELEDGYYWVKYEDGEMIVEYYNRCWYLFGSDYDRGYLPEGYLILGKVPDFNESK